MFENSLLPLALLLLAETFILGYEDNVSLLHHRQTVFQESQLRPIDQYLRSLRGRRNTYEWRGEIFEQVLGKLFYAEEENIVIGAQG